MNRVTLVTAACVLALAASAADLYEVDVYHTSIGFSVSHMVLANVKGSFGEFAGTVEYDGQDTASLRVQGSIKAASINTGIVNRDKHLRSPDFFDAEKHPDITFETVRVVKAGEGHVLTGNLTMHGVTRPISGPVVVKGPITDPYGKKRIGIEATTSLNRQDFGLKWSQRLDGGGLVVGDEVRIEISAEAILQEPAPAAAE